MSNFKFISLILISLTSIGCSTVFFPKTNYANLENISPLSARQEFVSTLPQRIQGINTIVFQYKWQSFSALGYIDVNLKLKTFAVSCLNLVGIKLFELSGDKDSVKANFVLKELLKHGNLPKVVGEDIRKIYFDNTPDLTATIKKEQYRIIFRQPAGPGVINYIFAGNQPKLIEKRYYEKNRLLWCVFYYQYYQHNNQFYPQGIVLKNYRFGYNLIVRLKEVRQ